VGDVTSPDCEFAGEVLIVARGPTKTRNSYSNKFVTAAIGGCSSLRYGSSEVLSGLASLFTMDIFCVD
jgi:hypothetical protein